MRIRTLAPAVFLLATVAGCGPFLPAEERCERKVTNEQGEVYRCIAVEDCPRPSNVLLCVADTDTRPECMRCLDTECVRISPEAC